MNTNNKNGLIEEELEVMDYIGKAWGAFVKLEKQHPSDLNEFHAGIHKLQQLIAIRILRRQYPDYWLSHIESAKKGSKICEKCFEKKV